eukprot:4621862-Alexandrium_andersonii.AAC.1
MLVSTLVGLWRASAAILSAATLRWRPRRSCLQSDSASSVGLASPWRKPHAAARLPPLCCACAWPRQFSVTNQPGIGRSGRK